MTKQQRLAFEALHRLRLVGDGPGKSLVVSLGGRFYYLGHTGLLTPCRTRADADA